MGKIVTKTGANGQYYFSPKANNGQKILASERYNSKSACTNRIDSVTNNLKDDSKMKR